MKLLAYDSSSPFLSAAMLDGEKLLAEIEEPAFTRRSGSLVPILKEFVERTPIALSGLDYLAVGIGPGSFTGLRVGITTAKMLASARRSLRLVGVSSLETIAAGVQAVALGRPTAVILDAKKGLVYGALYRAAGSPEEQFLETLVAPGLFRVDELLGLIRGGAFFVGDGASLYTKRIQHALGEEAEISADERMGYPRAEWVGRLALPLIRRREWITARELKPIYLHSRECTVVMKDSKQKAQRI